MEEPDLPRLIVSQLNQERLDLLVDKDGLGVGEHIELGVRHGDHLVL
jgi:hypothetical protein